MKYLIFLLLTLVFIGCNNPVKRPTQKKNPWSRDHSVSYHKEVNEREQLSISFYLEQHPELKNAFVMTQSGLRYSIIKKNEKGKIGEPGTTASIILKIRLLDGSLCYETPEDYYDEVPIDHNDQESGLNEALKLMRKGESAKLILPNHLAHGLVGDLDKIPPLAILLLDVELIDLK